MITDATQRLRAAISEGRLIRNKWAAERAGRHYVCLLAALSPEVAAALSASVCPAEIMPQWLAHLTPWLDDAGSAAAWPAMVARYADLAERWHVLDAAAWQRLDWRCQHIAVLESMRHTTNAAALVAFREVVALLDRAIGGDEPTPAEWRSAAGATWSAAGAAWSAAESAAGAAESAEIAAWSAADRMTSELFDAIEAEIGAAQ